MMLLICVRDRTLSGASLKSNFVGSHIVRRNSLALFAWESDKFKCNEKWLMGWINWNWIDIFLSKCLIEGRWNMFAARTFYFLSILIFHFFHMFSYFFFFSLLTVKCADHWANANDIISVASVFRRNNIWLHSNWCLIHNAQREEDVFSPLRSILIDRRCTIRY